MGINDQLQQIQSTLEAPKDLYNAFGKYKYRSLEGIMKAVKPLLKEHNVALYISDRMVEVGGRVYVEATATLSNGKESISVTASAREAETKKGMDDAQITGACSSYARKYACNGLFAIDDTKDADATNDHGKSDLPPNPEKQAKFENAGYYNGLAAEISNCTNQTKLDKWCKDNSAKIAKLNETDKERLRGLVRQYKSIFESDGDN